MESKIGLVQPETTNLGAEELESVLFMIRGGDPMPPDLDDE